MTSSDEKKFHGHIAKYEHNKDFIAHGIVDRSKFVDWELIASFYAVIHLIEAVLVKEFGETPANHNDRKIAMLNHPNIFQDDVIFKYSKLSNYAHTARYHPWVGFPSNVALDTQNCLEDIDFCLKSYIP